MVQLSPRQPLQLETLISALRRVTFIDEFVITSKPPPTATQAEWVSRFLWAQQHNISIYSAIHVDSQRVRDNS